MSIGSFDVVLLVIGGIPSLGAVSESSLRSTSQS